MRRLLYILGALTFILVLLGGIGLAVLFYNGNKLDTESKAFVDRVLPAIVISLSSDRLFEYATDELRANASPADLRALFDNLSRLGPLVEYQGATGQSNLSYAVGSGRTISAAYVAQARFENGSSTFRVVLLKRDDRWLFHSFFAEPAFQNRPSRGT